MSGQTAEIRKLLRKVGVHEYPYGVCIKKDKARQFEILQICFSEQHGFCFWCYKSMKQPIYGQLQRDQEPSLEHLIRRRDKGETVWENLVAAHAICNYKRA